MKKWEKRTDGADVKYVLTREIEPTWYAIVEKVRHKWIFRIGERSAYCRPNKRFVSDKQWGTPATAKKYAWIELQRVKDSFHQHVDKRSPLIKDGLFVCECGFKTTDEKEFREHCGIGPEEDIYKESTYTGYNDYTGTKVYVGDKMEAKEGTMIVARFNDEKCVLLWEDNEGYYCDLSEAIYRGFSVTKK